MGPQIIQHPLTRADGSTAFSSELYTVLAGVNGPVEVQRRDELPEEAAIEVNLRPASGVGGPRERWLENVLQSALKSILLVHMHPRTLIQVTLQITKEPAVKFQRTTSDIAMLPTLLNAAFSALVDGALPLASTISTFLAVVAEDGTVVLSPQEEQIIGSKSIHAMAFDHHGAQILDESSGEFTTGIWGTVFETTKQACAAAISRTGDEAMSNADVEEVTWLRQKLEQEARLADAWREST
ncbi:related to RRP46 protein, involved in rRNA processing [Ramularia collo-cygni]|uniref:Related to RRP46 protein, involved in rRNA processing n=1 Tax=Ramularia collo-cygni TaxID=112498 RepID=A0A2D3V0S1_9PEZI|nr:related to RRP46 protein, involved in rRNA processing [Ramularia collo-cygni]CZT17126.1 related to RRP46 protein, involved in rRNA processing [Ramularia collo-cygni]